MKKLVVLLTAVMVVAFAAPAFAANPFMDVPMNHWAYDAISQLAAKGVVNGYPDGTFRGNQPMTRYEMATIVARALAVVDMDKASKQDVEMLKKLVVEFKDELDALGVKVDDLDERVAVLEEDIGGWTFWGELRSDWKFADQANGTYTEGDTDIVGTRYRLWMRKYVDDKVTFTGRITGEDATWSRFNVTIQMPWDIEATIGKMYWCWGCNAGLYNDWDTWFDDNTRYGALFTKDFGLGTANLYVTHTEDGTAGAQDLYDYALRFNFDINEKMRFAAMYRGRQYDDENAALADGANPENQWNMMEADFTVNFTPDVAMKGAYMVKDIDYIGAMPAGFEDSPAGYKAILDVGQDTLRFTSAWLEYGHMDGNFTTDIQPIGWVSSAAYDVFTTGGSSTGFDRNYGYGYLNQQWTDKFSTFQRYASIEVDRAGDYDLANLGAGMKYWYTPNMYFELYYGDWDYGDAINAAGTPDDNVVRLRTRVYF
ncbi:MAG: S-layer homology domain-containing protein [Synergistales bacterium]|nr:S-layer homology domain-containing protein [Synergistales bacterium]